MPKSAAKILPITAAATISFKASDSIQTVKMTFGEFNAIPTNPGNRDHQSRPLKKFGNFKAPHLKVSACVLPCGTMFKADGHTRFHAANSGVAAHLKSMIFSVDIYSVHNVEEAIALCDLYDNTEATKNGKDKVQSGLRISEIEAKSYMVKKVMTSGLDLAYKTIASIEGLPRNISKQSSVSFFKDAILLVDDMHLNHKRFPIGIVAATLLAFYKHGENAKPFFAAYSDTQGLAVGTKRDGVRMMHDFISAERRNGTMAGITNNERHMLMAFAMFERYLGNSSVNFEKNPTPKTAKSFFLKA